MHGRSAVAALVAVVISLVPACGGGSDHPSAAERCESEFAAAEKVPSNERRPGLLFDAAVACSDRSIWVDVAKRHADVLDGRASVDVLADICNNGGEPRLANSDICADL